MTDAPQPNEPGVLAGEYVLGVLDGADLAGARRRLLGDPGFAAEVVYWEQRLGGLAVLAGDIAPSPALWDAIERQLADRQADDTIETLPIAARPARRWNIAAAISMAALAGVAMMLYLDAPRRASPAPDGVAEVPAQLIAQLGGAATQASVIARVDPASNRIALRATGMANDLDDRTAPELWVIPAGGTPRSLGLIPAEGEHSRVLTPAEARLMAAGATLAVTYENRTGAPHDGPTSDIVVSGTVIRI